MIDFAIGFILDNIWIVCFLAAGLYNIYLKKDYKPIIHISLIIAGVFGFSKLVYTNLILPQENLVEIYYLFWAGVSAFLAIIITLDHQVRSYAFHWPAKLTIFLFVFECFLNIAVHIDRNIFALNGAMVPNVSKQDAWFLWGIRNFFLNFDNALILLSLFFPYKAFKRHQVYTSQGDSVFMDDTFKRLEIIEDMVFAMPDSFRKKNACQCLVSARFLLEQWNENGEDRQHIYCANILCNEARSLALCSGEIREFETVSNTSQIRL